MKRLWLAVLLCSCSSGALVDASAPVSGAEPAVAAHVVCRPRGKRSVACAISHDAAGRCAVCWVLRLECANGRSMTAETCDDIPPGTELDHVLDDFRGRANCDAIESGALTAAWTRDCSS
jgi:hypothetical protein